MKKHLFITLSFLLALGILNAQETVKFSAEIRPRLELDGRDFNENTGFKNFTALRSRAGLSFTPTSDLKVFIQLQDSRDFGSESSISTSMKNVDVHQAYFKLNNIFGLPADLKIGRMELHYGSGRFIGSGNWGPNGKAFDGAVITLKTDNAAFDFLAIKEKEEYNFDDSADVDILALLAKLNFLKGQKIEPFIIWQKNVPVQNFNRISMGLYLKGNVGNFYHESDFAYQLGELIDYDVIEVPPGAPAVAAELDIASYVLSSTLGYKFYIPVKTSLSIGIDILSGDENSADNSYTVFASPYGSKHKFYGFMDYFKNIPLNTYNLGLIDIRGGIAVEPFDKLSLKLDLHLLNSEKDYTLAEGNKSRQFGTEGDLTLKYKYNEYVTFQTGASLFIPGEIFKETKGKDNSFWFYFMTVANL